MTNKYLTKLASSTLSSQDKAIATKSKGEEDKAIHDYAERLDKVENPLLRKAISHALEEEKSHSKGFREVLEKQALNALKARQMARQAGIIPDPHSAWRYALRNVRGGEYGELLQGRKLQEAKIKLGDLSNNAYQATAKFDRGPGQYGIESTGKVNRIGKLEDGLTKGEVGKVNREAKGRLSDNLHTHPPRSKGFWNWRESRIHIPGVKTSANPKYPFNPRNTQNGNTHRVASPSGLSSEVPKDQYGLAARLYARGNSMANEAKSLIETLPSENFSDLSNISQKRALRRAVDLRNRSHAAKLFNRITGSDLKETFSSDLYWDAHSLKHPFGDVQKISAPSVNTTSSYRLTKNGPRVVYFDHTPRKARG